jgi:uncharacterized membrane protein
MFEFRGLGVKIALTLTIVATVSIVLTGDFLFALLPALGAIADMMGR